MYDVCMYARYVDLVNCEQRDKESMNDLLLVSVIFTFMVLILHIYNFALKSRGWFTVL